MKAVIALLAIFSTLTAQAEVTGYACNLRIFAKDLRNGFQEARFETPVQGGEHGGPPIEISYGDHTVSALVDGRWRNVSWWYKGRLVTAAVTSASARYETSFALVLYNPANVQEQVGLDCDVKVQAAREARGSSLSR